MATTYKVLGQVNPSATTATTLYTYIVYGATVPASDATMLTLGITLATTDVVTVYASSANLSFNLFGSEIA